MMEKFKAFVVGMKRPRMERRIPALFVSVILMGFGVAVFDMIGFGTDPCSVMNLGLSMNLGIPFGTLQLTVDFFLCHGAGNVSSDGHGQQVIVLGNQTKQIIKFIPVIFQDGVSVDQYLATVR